MTGDVISWPLVRDGRRMYVARPTEKDWKLALKDYHNVERGGRPKDVWIVRDWSFRRGDFLVTYMQTSPMMVVHLDRLEEDAANTSELVWSQLCHFTYGIPVALVYARTGVDLATVDTYLDTADARKVVKALRQEYQRDVGIFGDPRIARHV